MNDAQHGSIGVSNVRFGPNPLNTDALRLNRSVSNFAVTATSVAIHKCL